MLRSRSIIDEALFVVKVLVEETHVNILVFCDTLERTGLLIRWLEDRPREFA